MVVGILASLAGFVKVNASKTKVDNAVFKLHYRWTTSFCYVCCALVAAADFIGSPIECQGEDVGPPVTTFCWITSTYTINTTTKEFDFKYYGSVGSSHVGIGTYNPEIHEKTFHAYYQWVPFLLFFQGVLFYLPHQLWKSMEGKQLDNLLQGLNIFSPGDETIDTKKQNVVKYLTTSYGLNNKYFYGYFFCEVLNFVNVVGQMFLLDWFFGGMFLHYGTKILFLPLEDDRFRFDPMIETFPRVTKCDFVKVGVSGSYENKDYLCILPQNLLNEKIFLVMWVWFVILACATTVQIIFHVALTQLPIFRIKLIEKRGKLEDSFQVDSLLKKLNLGDFFLLYSIGNNVDTMCFRDILKGLLDAHRTTPTAPAVFPNFSTSSILSTTDEVNTIDLRLRKKIMEDSV